MRPVVRFVPRDEDSWKQGLFFFKNLVDLLLSFDRVAPLVERRNPSGKQPSNCSNRFVTRDNKEKRNQKGADP